jgi:hypothetical protein
MLSPPQGQAVPSLGLRPHLALRVDPGYVGWLLGVSEGE